MISIGGFVKSIGKSQDFESAEARNCKLLVKELGISFLDLYQVPSTPISDLVEDPSSVIIREIDDINELKVKEERKIK